MGAALNSRDVVVVGAAVAIALGTLTACSTATPGAPGLPNSSAAGQAGPANTLTPSCPAPPDPAARPPVTVAELNTLVARVDLPGWQSADIGASARLTDGRLVWVFGTPSGRPAGGPSSSPTPSSCPPGGARPSWSPPREVRRSPTGPTGPSSGRCRLP